MWRAMAQAVMIPQPEVTALVESTYLERLTWASAGSTTPFGALHIRRGDKVAEVGLAGLPAEHVRNVCVYADTLGAMLADSGQKLQHVFVATDDLSVIEELRRCPTAADWTLHSFNAQPLRGMSAEVVLRVWAEITLLARASHAVGTFSSALSKVAQLLRVQPAESFISVDLLGSAVPEWR